MLLPYYELKQRAQNLLSDETLDDASFIPFVNMIQKRIEHEANWWFLEKKATSALVSGQATYPYPTAIDKNGLTYCDVRKLTEISIQQTALTTPIIYDYHDYRNISPYLNGVYSIMNNTIILKPIPTASTAGYILNEYYIRILPDFIPDRTTGTMTVTNGSATVAGVGIQFHDGMVNSYVQFGTDTTWYKIASVTNANAFVLEQTYKGVTAAGIIYRCSYASEIPQEYHEALVQGACALYKNSQEEYSEAIPYYNDYSEVITLMRKDQSQRVIGQQSKFLPRSRRFIV